jgi:site-specific DNA recombinase
VLQPYHPVAADQVLIHVRDGAPGHTTRMRWNDQDQRIWPEAIAHPPIIDEETFRRAAEMLAARGGGPAVHDRCRFPPSTPSPITLSDPA